jgi:CRP-like cAMP-binding protein
MAQATLKSLWSVTKVCLVATDSGVNVLPLRAIVQGKGLALRMSGVAFSRELGRSAALRRELHRYLKVRMCQLARVAACTRFHLVEQRLARGLLMTRDRARSVSHRLCHLSSDSLPHDEPGLTSL